jgi:hypothetical protein
MTTVFVLMVLVGSAPPYRRDEFRSYESCVAAAYGEIESLRAIEGQAVTWQCVPDGERGDF